MKYYDIIGPENMQSDLIWRTGKHNKAQHSTKHCENLNTNIYVLSVFIEKPYSNQWNVMQFTFQ